MAVSPLPPLSDEPHAATLRHIAAAITKAVIFFFITFFSFLIKKTGCCRAGNTLRFPASENRTRTFAPVGRIESSKISACIADLSKAEIGVSRHCASAGVYRVFRCADAHCRISLHKNHPARAAVFSCRNNSALNGKSQPSIATKSVYF